MKNFLWIVLALSLIGCAQQTPPVPAQPPGTPTTSGGKWGTHYDSVIQTCAEIYAEYFYSSSQDWNQNVQKWTTYCQCYYSVISAKYEYTDYLYNAESIDAQYSNTAQGCMPKSVASY